MAILRNDVLTSVRHQLPERVPAYVEGFDDEQTLCRAFGMADVQALLDRLGVSVREVITPLSDVYVGNTPQDENGHHLDPFGVPFSCTYADVVGIHPLAGAVSIAEVEAYSWPNPDYFDYQRVELEAKSLSPLYAVKGGWAPVFCQVMNFFGMEKAMINMKTCPEIIEATVAHILAFYLCVLERVYNVCQGYLDFAPLGDDFAGQHGPLISPDVWRHFFKQAYVSLFEQAKEHGLMIWFHACGTFREVLPDLVDAGLDVWAPVQVHLAGNNPVELKREYGKHITFAGGISTQWTLPFSSPEDVRAEVRERIQILGRGGGYICGPDHTVRPEVPVENVKALFDEIRSFRAEGITRDGSE